MTKKIGFIIFAHTDYQNLEDLQDLIDNISFFCDNSDFFVNHPTIEHPKIKTKFTPGKLNESSFIFGALIEIIKSIDLQEINDYSHFCLVSANQYFINNLKFEENVNYVQFVNKENWAEKYNGKDFDKSYEGFPLNQPYGRWDKNDMYKKFELLNPMSANWECLTFTKEVMILAKDNLEKIYEFYNDTDLMNIFIPYMVLMSGQSWQFPPHFGTYDPSNRPVLNYLISTTQIKDKRKDGYFSIKRVNYSKNCILKEFVRNNYMT